jgi:two-component system sensor histidine kinase QseC
MRSLSTTLILGTIIGTAAVLLTVGLLVYVLVRTDLVEQFDHALVDKALLLASTVELEEGELDLQFSEFDMREFEKLDRPAYLQLWLADGSVLFRSESLGTSNLDMFCESGGAPAYCYVTLPAGRPGRAVSIAFAPKLEYADSHVRRESPLRRITLMLARDTAPIRESLARVTMLLAMAGFAAILLSAAILWLVVRRSLQPLKEMAAEISQLDEQDLSARVKTGHSVRELHPVGERLNELLGRLEAVFERERSFSADVAHELRTPLAGLRSTIDVILSKPREAAEYAEALKDSLQITVNMHSMVENLLTLARLEAGHVEIQAGPVDVNELARSTWKLFSEKAAGRNLQVEWALGPAVSTSTDSTLLGMMLGNVIGNAVQYSDEGGTVRIETQLEEGGVTIRVSNTGSNLSQEQAEHVFERFWRGDAARSAAGIRCGLGLSLVDRTLSVLGGSAEAQSEPGGMFALTIRIPRE